MILLASSQNAWAEDASSAADLSKLSGYVKTLYIDSRTNEPEDKAYDLSLSRLRLKLDAGDTAKLSLHVEHDTELRLGNFLDTREFAQSREQQRWQYKWSGDSKLASSPDYYLSQRFYRGYVRAVWNDFDVVAGRQRIPLGTGRFWSALDLLNSDNPVRMEADERIGVDAVKLEYKFSSLARWTYIVASDPLDIGLRQIMQLGVNWNGVDITITGGDVRHDRVGGVDFATQIFGAGVRGEWVYVDPDIGENYQKGLIGVDYGFENGLTLSAEAFRSTQSSRDIAATAARIPQLPFLQAIGRKYIGGSATYEPNPLYKLAVTWLKNQEDHSDFASIVFTYTVTENTSIALGTQDSTGASTSEYGRAKPLYFTYVQWFF